MKLEWKKHEREWYGVKNKPQVVTLPQQNFLMIKGTGNPNLPDFSERVGVLYSLAYPIKMGFKAFYRDNADHQTLFEFDDFAVFPLEGVWTSTNPDNPLDKDSFSYTLMIKQPDFITQAMFDAALVKVEKKKPHPLLKDISVGSLEEGLCVQLLHKGAYDDEPASFAIMDEFVKENGFKRLNHFHREIYLSDARKTAPEKRLTILRYQID